MDARALDQIRVTGMSGRFVVIEGIDGAGTTTQVGRLVDRLRKKNIQARGTREPSDGPVGTLIRQVLAGRVVVPGGRAPGWGTMALLFAADRVDHVEAEIEPALAVGRRSHFRSLRRVEPRVSKCDERRWR